MNDLHAAGPQEHMLCGLAEDAYDSGDWPLPVIPADKGQEVTCKECRQVIVFVRQNFKDFKQK